MASTVSVTNIHSWLEKEGVRTSEGGRVGVGDDVHLELLRLKDESEVEELARRVHELEEI